MAERILVVDDEETNRDLLEAILAQDGYQVELFSEGAVALARAMESPPDLILLDLMMPGMTGLEICQRLKQHPVTSAIPIIIVTAIGQMATKEAALAGGADDFVTKPVRPDDLRARVNAMLKVRRIRAEMDRTLAYLHELEVARFAQRRATLDVLGANPSRVMAGVPEPVPILLVDDEALTREFYGDLLTAHGFRVFAAASGAGGLELARQHHVDVAILDIVMPEMSGLEVLGTLHQDFPDLPVIMLTGHSTSRNAIAALKLGAFDFIMKGFDHDLIVLTVHRAVRHRRETLKRTEEMERLRARLAELEAERIGRRAS